MEFRPKRVALAWQSLDTTPLPILSLSHLGDNHTQEKATMYFYAFAPSYVVLMLTDHIDTLRDILSPSCTGSYASLATQAPELTMRLPRYFTY